ncbi:uncharacterized protein BP5553_03398 [Venustampulla echinocandica]|uniref:Thiolase-like protein n=1 Tax=Venustampulla echinocandica TaxID=2656787 RepID=A0A370TU94_9HELO|nr:uncharacterized protein BP5553_03398 [Venustampulla echinocandica]RDL39058.1 hypothetical protein BP5553_03398 [Venustampulla echinocandica]
MGSILDPSLATDFRAVHSGGFYNAENEHLRDQENGLPVEIESSPECSQDSLFEPIAIIGMAFKFPQGAETSDTFWKLLEDSQCTATTFPKDRFNIDAFWHPDSKRQNIMNSREAHFMNGNIGDFDAGFFSMTPQEVGAMDPQQRGLLETTYHAFENAGLPLEKVAGSDTSVHIGRFTSDFSHLMLKDAQQIPKYAAIGTAGSVLANRLMGLSLQLSREQLNSGKANMAIAGAANIILNPEFNIALSNMNFLSPSGRCKSFDAKGDGYGRGEGFSTLILKRVATAIADGDPIRAVIRSVGTNQDGYTAGGITQPSKEMQASLIRDTYRKAGLSLEHTRFFEAHGTGTAVGDPIEARTIGETFLEHRSKQDPIYVGAVKSNIGHLGGTSGLASIVKTVLALERGVIPPNANFNELNPHIDAEFLNLKFPTRCVPWPKGEVRRASVNSFGFGGTHVVIESAEDFLQGRKSHFTRREAEVAQTSIPNLNTTRKPCSKFWQCHPLDKIHDSPEIPGKCHLQADYLTHASDHELHSTSVAPGNCVSHNVLSSSFWPKLLVVSAADEDGIKRQAAALSQFVESHSQKSDPQFLHDVFHTLNARRTLFNWKSYAVLDSDSASPFLLLENGLSKAIRCPLAATRPRLGLVFTGQGAQWAGMGQELLEWPVFRSSIGHSQKYLDILGCDWILIDEITKDAELSRINDTEFSQAVSTALQIALVDLTRHLSLNVSVVLGHSSGEIAAAYCAGFLCHESAIKVAYFRGVLASDLAKSCEKIYGMLSVGVSASQIRQELLPIHCINSPKNITLSGPAGSLNIIMEDLKARSIFARKLKVDLGYHSPQMRAIAEAYSDRLKDLRPGNMIREIRMVSSVSSRLVTQETVCAASYWVQNMLSPIEIGPHAALKGPLREIFISTNRADSMFYASFLTRNKSPTHTILETVGQFYCRNFEADLDAIARMSGSELYIPLQTITTLPPYPFNHTVSYWEEPARSKTFKSRKHANNDLLGAPVIDWNPLDARWRLVVKREEMSWIEQHKVHGEMLYPAAGMLVMAIEAIKQLVDQKIIGYEIRNTSFPNPIVLSDSAEGTEIQTNLIPTSTQAGEPEYKFRILVKRADDSWQETCLGTITADTSKVGQDVDIQTEEEHKKQAARGKYNEAVRSCQSFVEPAELYRRISKNTGLLYGPMFQPLSNIHYSLDGQGHAQILPCKSISSEIPQPFTVHPSTLDGVFQLTYVGLGKGWSQPTPTRVPSHLKRLWISTVGVGHSNLGSEVANSSSSSLNKRTAVGTSTVFSKTDMSIRLEVEALEVTELAGNQYVSQEETSPQPVCQRLE